MCCSDGGAQPVPGRPGPEWVGCGGIASTRSPSLEGLTVFRLQPHARLPEVVLRGNKRTPAVLRPVPPPSGGTTLPPCWGAGCSRGQEAHPHHPTTPYPPPPPRWAAPCGPQGASPVQPRATSLGGWDLPKAWGSGSRPRPTPPCPG